MTIRQIVLASSSPWRQEILARLGLRFVSVSPDIDERPHEGEDARALVARLALEKSRAVARQFPDALIIGADQIAEHQGQLLGKPGNHANAVKQLQAVSGSSMTLYTGLALLNSASGKVQSAVETFVVTYRELSRDKIERYLRAEKPYQCCGGLMVERGGIALIKSMRGDDFNALIGLPVIQLVDMLQNEGVETPGR